MPSWMTPCDSPSAPSVVDNVSREEIVCHLKRSRNGYSPCLLDQIPYKILKKCPSIIDALLNIYNHCLYLSAIPASWKLGVTKLLGKPAAKLDAHDPSNYRPITLTPCIGKVFTAILKTRLLDYMLANNYMNTCTQKAFISSLPG